MELNNVKMTQLDLTLAQYEISENDKLTFTSKEIEIEKVDQE